MSSNTLFVNRKDIVSNTVLGGNLDTDKFIQFVRIAQEIHIQNYLGTKLFDKLLTDIAAGTITGVYLDLWNGYVKQMTVHWAMVEYLPFAAYTVANKGVFKHGSENSETVTKDEVDFLVEKQRNTAQHYTRRFIDFMCYNKQNFPEYEQNEKDDVRPDGTANFGGWVI